MHLSITNKIFLELLKVGLWGDLKFKVEGLKFKDFQSLDWDEVYHLAQEQAVQGLVLQGIEAVHESWLKVHGSSLISQMLLLQWIGEVQMLEQQNKAMNQFIAELIEKLRKADIYALLVKGQGVAQCFERPLWRSCGDVDLLLSDSNYERAKEYLIPLADHVDSEDKEKKHLGMRIGNWIVELHGTMHTEISRRVNKGIDNVQDDLFFRGNVRSWNNSGTTVFLPSPDNDVILVFTHILEHFFVEGVGLKQVCDWCRLLWSYRSVLDLQLLESRIRKMGLMTEWKAFGALAVNALGMPREAMPMYDSRFNVKGDWVLERILKSGNMGHNKDLSYRVKYTGIKYKMVSLWRRLKDFAGFIKIFPIDAPRFFLNYVTRKV